MARREGERREEERAGVRTTCALGPSPKVSWKYYHSNLEQYEYSSIDINVLFRLCTHFYFVNGVQAASSSNRGLAQ